MIDMDEARAAVAREQCALHGHTFELVLAALRGEAWACAWGSWSSLNHPERLVNSISRQLAIHLPAGVAEEPVTDSAIHLKPLNTSSMAPFRSDETGVARLPALLTKHSFANGSQYRVGAVTGSELHQDGGHVVLHRALGQAHQFGDLAVGVAFGH